MPAPSLVSILVPMPVLEPGQGWPGASVYAGQGRPGASVNAELAPTLSQRQRWASANAEVGAGAGLAPGMMAPAVMPAPSPRHLS